MKIKEKFPNEEALHTFINEHSDEITWQVRSILGPFENEYKKARKQQLVAIGLFLLSMVLFTVMSEIASVGASVFAFFISILVLIIAASIGMNSAHVIRLFNKNLNKVVFPYALKIFNLSGTWQQSEYRVYRDSSLVLAKFSKHNNKHSDVHDSIHDIEHLNKSLLITEPRNTVRIEDTLEIDFYGRQLLVQEMNVTHVTGNGKTKLTKNIFKGYFVRLELKTKLNQVTFVSTDGDRNGFGNQSFLFNLNASKNKLAVTELEWNDFEKKLHVLTSDPVEARYILTPNFMLDLYQWWHQKNENIRVSFMDKAMCLLFPSGTIRINSTISRISDEELKEYVSSIATPLLHVLHLAEDVKEHM